MANVKITRETILRELLDMYNHSANYFIDSPKDGYRDEWETARARIAILEPWLAEFPRRRDGKEIREFIGTVGGRSHRKDCEGVPYCDNVIFDVHTAAWGWDYFNNDVRMFGIESALGDKWFGSPGDPCGKYDREKDRRDSRDMRIVVNSIGYITEMDWVEDESGNENAGESGNDGEGERQKSAREVLA